MCASVASGRKPRGTALADKAKRSERLREEEAKRKAEQVAQS